MRVWQIQRNKNEVTQLSGTNFSLKSKIWSLIDYIPQTSFTNWVGQITKLKAATLSSVLQALCCCSKCFKLSDILESYRGWARCWEDDLINFQTSSWAKNGIFVWWSVKHWNILPTAWDFQKKLDSMDTIFFGRYLSFPSVHLPQVPLQRSKTARQLSAAVSLVAAAWLMEVPEISSP